MKTTKIRWRVFETNSSSTHSLVICSEEDFERFKKGELVLDGNDKFLPIAPRADSDSIADDCDDYDDYEDEGKTYKQYFRNTELETFIEKRTTKSGDKIVAFGKYGYNG